VPEEFGGAGGALGDAAVVLEELVRAWCPARLLGTTLPNWRCWPQTSPTPTRWVSLAEGGAIGAVVFDATT